MEAYSKETQNIGNIGTFVHNQMPRGNKMEHPDKVYRSVTDYISKIFREDRISAQVSKGGASALHFHYGYAVF